MHLRGYLLKGMHLEGSLPPGSPPPVLLPQEPLRLRLLLKGLLSLEFIVQDLNQLLETITSPPPRSRQRLEVTRYASNTLVVRFSLPQTFLLIIDFDA